MKKRILLFFLIATTIISNFNIIFAKFSAGTAEDKLGSDEMYIERLKTTKDGKYSDEAEWGPETFEGDDDDAYIENAKKGDVYWFHCYYELSGMDNDDSTLGIDVKKGKIDYLYTNMKGKANQLTKDNNWDNSIEFMLKVSPMSEGDSKLRVWVNDDEDDVEFDFYIHFKNTKKSDEELEVDKINEAWKDETLLDTTGKDANKIAEDVALYISSDCKSNNGNKLMSWTKDEIIDKINKLKAASNGGYDKMISNLENIITVMDSGASQDKINEQKHKAINAIAADTAKKIQALLDAVTWGDDGDRGDVTFFDVLTNIDKYVPEESDDGIDEISKKTNIILTIITNIGMVIAVLMCAIIGIKYMLGSVEEKAEYKKDMIPYLVGAVLIFGICAIVTILQQFGENINGI